MTSPYTTQPLDALVAAQTSVGLLLTAVLWLRSLRPWLCTVLFFLAIAMVAASPVEGAFLSGIGVTLGPLHTKHLLKLAAALVTVSAIVTRRRTLAVSAAISEVVLWVVTGYLQDSDWELGALHLAVFGLLIGIHLRTLPAEPARPATHEGEPPEPRASMRLWIEDAVLAFGAIVLGSTVCWVVLHGWTNSADEWANTFQAALFAKGRAFGDLPHCAEAFRNFWVFQYMGRTFAQYTPGWPYFMTPFVALHVAWLAGPASLGLLAAGLARLTRRAAAGAPGEGSAASSSRARVAGRFGAFAGVVGATVLINGASRYPHVFVAATYAWSVEALFSLTSGPLSRRDQWRWGTVLGASACLMLAARPGDGATLGIGLFVYFVYAVARRRFEVRGLAGAAIAFAGIGAVTLVVLRLQLGHWFRTGYSLTAVFYPWSKPGWSVPHPNEFKYPIPLAIGSYGWWPCSPAVGLLGLAALRGRAQRIAFVFFAGFVPFLILYTLLEFGRGFDLGYGPRYLVPAVVPMAVGTGVVLGQLWTAAVRPGEDANASRTGAPLGIALTAVVLGIGRTAYLLYPATYADVVLAHNRLHEALAKKPVHNAVVFGGAGLTNTDPMDLTENLPMDLYPRQDVLLAIDRGPELVRCVKENYPTRTFYRAVPGFPVQVVPY